jgi:hypothetical protein
MQRSHWSYGRLLSAAAGDIAAGIAGGGGEEGLLGQAHPAVLQLLFVNALAGRLAGSSRAGRHLNKRGSVKGRYNNPIPTRFLVPVDCLKIPARRWNFL